MLMQTRSDAIDWTIDRNVNSTYNLKTVQPQNDSVQPAITEPAGMQGFLSV